MGQLRKHEKGHLVGFTNPTTRRHAFGSLVDEVWAVNPDDPSFQETAPDNEGWRQGAFLAQLVDWDGEKRVRFTYYVRRAGSGPNDWHYGGQYAASMSVDECRRLVEQIQERGWLDRETQRYSTA